MGVEKSEVIRNRKRGHEVGGEIPEQLHSLLKEEGGPTIWELMESYGCTPKPPRKTKKNKGGKGGPSLFLLPYENQEEILDLLLRFLQVYEEDPQPIAPEALFAMAGIVGGFVSSVRAKGPLREESYIALALATFRAMTGYAYPALISTDPEMVDWFVRLINTATLLLRAHRRTIPPERPIARA
jgi:hypothetical protein